MTEATRGGQASRLCDLTPGKMENDVAQNDVEHTENDVEHTENDVEHTAVPWRAPVPMFYNRFRLTKMVHESD